MAYQVSKTSAMQTAIKAGVDIGVAELQAGIINTHEELVQRIDELKDGFLSELYPTVDADNENLVANSGGGGSSAQVGPSGNGASSGGKPFSVLEAATTVVTFGAFKGLTIEQIDALTAAEAATYSKTQGKDYKKSGHDWLVWASDNTEKGAFLAARAKAYLASV